MASITVSPVPLLTFAELAGDPHFTRAAERLGLTQPAVTQHVRQLERAFGLKLVDQVGRRVELTEAGRFLGERCRRLADDVATVQREMREYAAVETGELRLGATVTIGNYAIGPAVAAFRKAYPRIALHVAVDNTDHVAAAVLAGRLAVGLIEGDVADPQLDVVTYADDRLVVAVPCTHPFAWTRQPVSVADLVGQPFIARERGSGTRAQVERLFEAIGAHPDVVLELPTGEGIVQAVESGAGIGIVSALVTRSAENEGRIVTIDVRDADLRRAFHLIRRRDVTPSPAARSFAAIVLGAASGTPA